MKEKQILREGLILAVPLLLFVILIVPYSWLNQAFIVEWLGCGCPVMDGNGNMVEPVFNANDFTGLFWLFISLCATGWTAFLAKRISKSRKWLRVVYVIAIFLVSVILAYYLRQMMMWN